MAESLAFEKALEKLERIVEDLESGDVKLDDALKKYEEGVRLSRACQQKLEQAEKKIEILSRSLEGEIEKSPFDAGISEESSRGEQGRNPRRKKEDEADEDYLL